MYYGGAVAASIAGLIGGIASILLPGRVRASSASSLLNDDINNIGANHNIECD